MKSNMVALIQNGMSALYCHKAIAKSISQEPRKKPILSSSNATVVKITLAIIVSMCFIFSVQWDDYLFGAMFLVLFVLRFQTRCHLRECIHKA